jgi:hypothetical protein
LFCSFLVLINYINKDMEGFSVPLPFYDRVDQAISSHDYSSVVKFLI